MRWLTNRWKYGPLWWNNKRRPLWCSLYGVMEHNGIRGWEGKGVFKPFMLSSLFYWSRVLASQCFGWSKLQIKVKAFILPKLCEKKFSGLFVIYRIQRYISRLILWMCKWVWLLFFTLSHLNSWNDISEFRYSDRNTLFFFLRKSIVTWARTREKASTFQP